MWLVSGVISSILETTYCYERQTGTRKNKSKSLTTTSMCKSEHK